MNYYKELKINNFRQFQNKYIILGKYLTVLSGRNSTGKSTILGMLGNSGELKKSDGETLTGKAFRADFSEIFKGSKQFDLPESDRFEITLCDENENVVDYRKFRTAWQSRDKRPKRFRVIPLKQYDENGKKRKTEKKFTMPVYYLGLSRLYPIGEASDERLSAKIFNFINDEDKNWFIDNYTNILSLQSKPEEFTNYSINGMNGKSGIGVNTEHYDYLTNSSGQDNLGQILIALLSFRNLRNQNEDNWKGGLLLIDEIDATLHPAAQNKLMQLLIKECKSIGMQIVFTTHSLSLLKYLTEKTVTNLNELNHVNNIELYYFSNANRKLDIFRNPSYTVVEQDLLVSSIVTSGRRVKVYSEDPETRYFIHHLIEDYEIYLDILDTHIGCQYLLDLCAKDPAYFCNVLIFLDGDVSDSDIAKLPKPIRKFNNILKIPGTTSPEELLYNYIINLDVEHPLWEQWSNLSLTWQTFKETGPTSDSYTDLAKTREKNKRWFNDYKSFFDSAHLMDYWKEDNKELVAEFRKNFVKSYNGIAKRLFLPEIPEEVDDQ